MFLLKITLSEVLYRSTVVFSFVEFKLCRIVCLFIASFIPHTKLLLSCAVFLERHDESSSITMHRVICSVCVLKQ